MPKMPGEGSVKVQKGLLSVLIILGGTHSKMFFKAGSEIF
jgi:hypothetical protein